MEKWTDEMTAGVFGLEAWFVAAWIGASGLLRFVFAMLMGAIPFIFPH